MYKAGSLESFAGSMAESIEREFEKIWEARFKTPLPEGTRDDRRLLFIAISHGILRYLREKSEEAFDVQVNVEQIPFGNLILSEGQTGYRYGSSHSHRHPVNVTQTEDSSDPSANKVKSTGEGLVNILMEELDS